MAKKVRDAAALAELFHILGDQTRLAILTLLLDREMNVSALCKKLNMAQPSVSHHLGILRMGRLVTTRRQGKQIHYSLRDLRRDRTGRALASLLDSANVVRIGPFALGLAED